MTFGELFKESLFRWLNQRQDTDKYKEIRNLEITENWIQFQYRTEDGWAYYTIGIHFSELLSRVINNDLFGQ